jgi:hypothetical protein
MEPESTDHDELTTMRPVAPSTAGESALNNATEQRSWMYIPVPLDTTWPALVGCLAEEAAARIKATHPDLRPEIIPPRSPVTMDASTTRVRIFVDNNNRVTEAPTIG